jgi:hypothetical protein
MNVIITLFFDKLYLFVIMAIDHIYFLYTKVNVKKGLINF